MVPTSLEGPSLRWQTVYAIIQFEAIWHQWSVLNFNNLAYVRGQQLCKEHSTLSCLYQNPIAETNQNQRGGAQRRLAASRSG